MDTVKNTNRLQELMPDEEAVCRAVIATKITYKTLISYRTGRRVPQLAKARILARHLKKSIDYIWPELGSKLPTRSNNNKF